MTQPFLPNEADAFNANQAEPDSVDFEILLLGYQRTGVISGCAVTESSPAAQTVDVALGVVSLVGSQITVSVQADVAVSAADGTNPRIDLITVNLAGTVVVTAGTAAAQPVMPAIPATSIPLAILFIAASDNVHANNQINDKRVLLDSPPELHIRYVDDANGSATNDGLTPDSAFDDIQDAYDDLPDGTAHNGRFAKGTVIIAPGDYDVVAGLILDRLRTASFMSQSQLTPFRLPGGASGMNQVRIFSSQGTLTSLVNWGAAGASNGYGFQFLGLNFDIDASQAVTAVIDGIDINHMTVEDCVFSCDVTDNAYAVQLVTDNTAGHDASWARINRNAVRFMNLFRADRNGQNSNQHVISNNIMQNADSGPIIELVENHRSVIRDNNIEGNGTFGIVLDGCWQCRSEGNGGEGIDIFTELRSTASASASNYISDIGINVPAAANRLVRILSDADAKNNMTVIHAATNNRGLYTTGYEDQTTHQENWVWQPSDLNARANIKFGGLNASDGDPEGNDVAQLGTLKARLDGPPFLYVHRDANETSTSWQVIAPDVLEVATAVTLDWTQGVVNMESAGGTRVVTLPDNAAFNGKSYLIRRDGSNTVTIDRAGSDTFDDADIQKTLDSDSAAIGIFSIGDGEWKIVATEGTVGGS